MSRVWVAATQFAAKQEPAENVATAERLIRDAAGKGADIVLTQELFETPYFCKDQAPSLFALAHPAEGHPTIRRMAALAAELNLVLPVSFFERANNAYYNSVMVIDADGGELGLYRKSHIPDGPGYQEKYYFNPGDTGFRVWDTKFGKIGIGICWDQWFPECARALALQGAEILLYPTAIGSEPNDSTIQSADHWQRVMQGHAGANMVPLVAANRVGREQGRSCALDFHGRSFIADPWGAKVAEAGSAEAVIVAGFDLEEIRARRASWGIFRDRRPDLYGKLLTLDGDQGGA